MTATPYTTLLLLMTGFIILILSLTYFNPDGFNTIVGYKLALAVPIMGIGMWIMFNITNKLAAFASMLALIVTVGMVYKWLPSSTHVNNVAIIMNVVSIVAFIIMSAVIYNPSGIGDPVRLKYTWVMFGFIMVLMTLYSTGVITSSSGLFSSSMFVSLFVGSLLVLLIVLGQQATSTNLLWNACMWLVVLTVSSALVYVAVDKLGSFQFTPDSTITSGHWVWNAVWLLVIVLMVYRVYAPHAMFSSLKYVVAMAILGFGAYGIYKWWKWMKPEYLTTSPVSTTKKTNISSYQELTKSDSYQYKYAISFWVYLDSFPPDNAKSMELISYGGTPAVDYNATTNTLRISVKNETGGTSIIYSCHPVELQKWNHILFNYDGGTLDVFYNGKLRRSSIEVVPYMKMDMLTVGEDNGANGHVGQLRYFTYPVNLETVRKIYKQGYNG